MKTTEASSKSRDWYKQWYYKHEWGKTTARFRDLANKKRPKTLKRSQKGQFLFSGLYHNIFKGEYNFQSARTYVQLFPSSPAILSKEKQLGKNKPEPPDSRSYRTCQSREHRAARLWQGLLNPMLLSCLSWIFPTAPFSVVLRNSTLAAFLSST